MKKKSIFLLLSVVMLCFSLKVIASDDNLIKNPSFENATTAEWWDTWAWKPEGTVFSVDKSQARSGGQSAKITNKKENDGRYRQTISVEENSIYKYSCWIKAREVGSSTKGANISIDGRVESSPDIKGTSGDWQYVEMYIQTGRGINSLILTFGLGGYGNINTGTAFFDDVEFVKADSIPAGAYTAFIEKESAKPGDSNGGPKTVSNSDHKTGSSSSLTLKNILLIIGGLVVLAGIITVEIVLSKRRKTGESEKPENAEDEDNMEDEDNEADKETIKHDIE